MIHKDETVFQLKQPQGEGIEIEDVLILVRALTGSNTDFTESARINSGNGYLVAKVDKDGFEMLDSEKINEILDKI